MWYEYKLYVRVVTVLWTNSFNVSFRNEAFIRRASFLIFLTEMMAYFCGKKLANMLRNMSICKNRVRCLKCSKIYFGHGMVFSKLPSYYCLVKRLAVFSSIIKPQYLWIKQIFHSYIIIRFLISKSLVNYHFANNVVLKVLRKWWRSD